MRLNDFYNMSTNQPLMYAVAGQCLKVANNVRNEDGNTANHDKRVAWAMRPATQNAQQLMLDIISNPTIVSYWEAHLADAETDRFQDSDIEYVVLTEWEKYALML